MKGFLYYSLIGICTLWAQNPTLVKDINPKGDSWGEFLDYEPSNGNKLLIADDSVHGYELWTTDGTTVGTKLLKEINPNGDAFVGTEFVTFKNELYFFADDGIHGAELWKTNGTNSGTALVKDLKATGGQDNPDKTNFVVIGDRFYFVAEDDTHGNEVWESDGTATGTKMLLDLNPTGSINGKDIIKLTSLNSFLVFVGMKNDTKALWKMNTTGDTTLLKVLNTVGSIHETLILNDQCYFSLQTIGGSELHVTNGTVTGTQFIKAINRYERDYVISNNDLYFLADSNDQRASTHLWKISGSNDKLTWVAKISSKRNNAGLGMKSLNNKLLFFAEHGTLGYVLYSSDGTSSGTKMLYDFDKQVTGEASDYYATFYHFANELYISAQIDDISSALFKTDGTKVQFLYDFNPGEGYGDVSSFGIIKNELYMIADGKDVGLELFKYDGSTTGLYEDFLNASSLSYPNPAHDKIYISDAIGVTSAQISDLSGKVLLQIEDLQTQESINISMLDKGVYVLELSSDHGSKQVQRFVKH